MDPLVYGDKYNLCSVKDVQEVIQYTEGLPTYKQRLVFQGRRQESSNALQSTSELELYPWKCCTLRLYQRFQEGVE